LIVLDASATVELILQRPDAHRIAARLAAEVAVHVPEHFHIEVLSALRRRALQGLMSERRAAEALDDLHAMRVERHAVLDTVADIWDLRHRLTAYDAAYLAVARRLDAPLLTLDAGLAAVASEEGRLAVLT
jgi:predicted nucleic acid-binding protein